MLLTVDSSVFVASIIEQEKYHESCKNIMTKIAKAEYIGIMPYSVLVETAASLRRRTGSESIAESSQKELQKIDAIFFLELTKERANEAADIAKTAGLKGMDAIVVQVARENNTTLITLDEEIIDRSKKIINAVHIEAFDAIDAKENESERSD